MAKRRLSTCFSRVVVSLDREKLVLSRRPGVLSSASRLFVEGMDFDLTYFPLKHLGYKSVVAVAGKYMHPCRTHGCCP